MEPKRNQDRRLPAASGERPSVATAHPLFDQLPEPVACVDETFAAVYVNAAFAALLGVSRGALLATRTWLVDLDVRAPGLTAALEHAARTGTQTTVDLDERQTLTVYRAGGALWIVARSGGAPFKSDPRIPVAAESGRDLPALAESIVSVIAHDLRTPLSAVTLAATMLELSNADARTLGVSARILASARRMRRMVEQLLDLTALRANGGVVLEKRTTSLSAIAQTLITELETAHGTIDARFESHGDARGTWDEDRLAQLVSNLLSNAMQHGIPGPVFVRVDGQADDVVTLEIENPGTIPAHQLHTVFDAFARTGRRVTRDGLGLGLYIARCLAEAHGGTLEVRSTSTPLTGPTTTFTLVLPRLAPDGPPVAFDALASRR